MPRIHTVGIDQAVNEGFLQRLAELGGGTCDVVESEDRLDEVMDQVHRAIGDPALTQLCLEPQGFELVADSLAPSRLPDLFADRPVTIFGCFIGDNPNLRLRLTATGQQPRHFYRKSIEFFLIIAIHQTHEQENYHARVRSSDSISGQRVNRSGKCP